MLMRSATSYAAMWSSTSATLERCWWSMRPGSPKKGAKSVGVTRQDTGTAGRIENCQVGVFLAYASRHGHALVDRELYLPRCWTDDPARCAEAGVPDQIAFHTKPQLAQAMLERAVTAGLPAGWVTADTIYGGDRRLRIWLEEQAIAYVLAARAHRTIVDLDQPRPWPGTCRAAAHRGPG